MHAHTNATKMRFELAIVVILQLCVLDRVAAC